MLMVKYTIYELSARAVMSYAGEENRIYTFRLNRTATEHCKVTGAKHEQDDCAMFFQLMCQIHGDRYRLPTDAHITDFTDVIFYMDFSAFLIAEVRIRHRKPAARKPEICFDPKELRWILAAGLTVMSALSVPPA